MVQMKSKELLLDSLRAWGCWARGTEAAVDALEAAEEECHYSILASLLLRIFMRSEKI